MKILWHGVPAEYPTGYGTQTNLFTPALQRMGHEVAVSSIVPCPPGYRDRNGIKVYSPGTRHTNGNDYILGHVADFKADVVISCMDTHIMDAKKFSQLWWIAWQVIDSAPLIPEMKKQAGAARTLLTMTYWGQDVLSKAGYSSEYCPLAFDKKDFFYDESVSREAFAKEWQAKELNDETFLVVMNSANMSIPSRKNFYAAFAGFEEFRKDLLHRTGRKAILYCHTEPTGILFGGENLCTIAEQLGIPTSALFFPIQYPYLNGQLPPAYLRQVYSMADCFLHTARGEGFGLPIVEAMACGCPLIIPHNSGMLDFVHGYPFYLHDQTPFASSSGTEQWIVRPQEIASVLSAIEANPEGSEVREARIAFAQQYEIESVSKMLNEIVQWSFSKRLSGVKVTSVQDTLPSETPGVIV